MDVRSSTKDSHSFAKPELARVIDTHLELNVNFERKILKGKAILTIERKHTINYCILDNYGLLISRIKSIEGIPLNYYVGIHGTFGRALYIQLPKIVDFTYLNILPKCQIQIEYETSPNSPALYWLTSEQTADGIQPFLVSNNKLMYARAVFPCQDTPSIKATYSANMKVLKIREEMERISVPKSFRVLMSATLQKVYRCKKQKIYQFFQTKPVPSHAVVIVVGSLETRKLGPRSDLYAEKKYIEKSFVILRSVKIERMLQMAESLCGPYVWDICNICVLPSSIDFFEIECPCLTFISPIMLGETDNNLIGTLVRNISQSWAGILVTCSNYDHLWLSKSFSSFIGNKIKYKMFDEEQFLFRRMELNNLNNMIKKFKDDNLLKCLLPNLTYCSPHDTKYVPYGMGCILLRHLEHILGGPSVFETFLKSYFHKFAYKSIKTEDWLNYLYKYFSGIKKNMLNGVQWKVHFYDIASPHSMPVMAKWERKCLNLAKEWVQWNCEPHFIPSLTIDQKVLSENQKIVFLYFLSDLSFYPRSIMPLTVKKLRYLSSPNLFKYSTGNSWLAWLILCIKANKQDTFQLAFQFATEFCSSNYVCPIFQSIYNQEKLRAAVIVNYEHHKQKMLYETQEKVNSILHINS